MVSALRNGFHWGKISSRRLASPTVMVLELHVSDNTFSFQPGQWIDFRVPPHEWTGGFSPVSLTRELPHLSIAVKHSSRAPPSQWVHSDESAEIGRPVQIRAGGKCILDKRNLWQQPVVFCAGGIGISPILSMYRQWVELQRDLAESKPCAKGPDASFLYSVSTQQELVFAEEIVEQASLTAHASTTHNVVFTITQQDAWDDEAQRRWESKGVQCRIGRCMRDFLQLSDPTSAFYICGPPPMLDEAVSLLQKRGVDESNIHFERWW